MRHKFHGMSRGQRFSVMASFGIVAIFIFTFIGGTAVQLLWNWLMPPLFGWREVTFWQALGLLTLCRILFGGFGIGGGSGRSHVRRRMAERWDEMTPEERERFRDGMAGRWGFGPSANESKTL